MGLKSLIQRQVQNAMGILGTDSEGLAQGITYIEVTESTYDLDAGAYTDTTTEHSAIPAVESRFTVDEMPADAVPVTDAKFLIAKLDLPVAPKAKDYLRTADGRRFEVVKLMGVPGESLYVLHVRLTA